MLLGRKEIFKGSSTARLVEGLYIYSYDNRKF